MTVLISGCGTIGPPVGDEREAVLQKKKSIVLMKINTVLCGKDRSFSLLPLRYASIDRGENVKDVVFLSSPSSEGRQRGWTYLTLEPGSYFFTTDFKNYNLFTIEYLMTYVCLAPPLCYMSLRTNPSSMPGLYPIYAPVNPVSFRMRLLTVRLWR